MKKFKAMPIYESHANDANERCQSTNDHANDANIRFIRMHYSNHSYRSGGFTLIELMVSMALLSMVLLIVLGLFSRFTTTQRLEIGEQQVQEDLRVVLEQLNREVRTAYGTSFPAGDAGSRLTLRNQNGQCVEYRLQDQQIIRTESVESEAAGTCEDGGLYPAAAGRVMTDREVSIDTLQFNSQPALVSDEGELLSQGYVTVLLAVRPAGAPVEAALQLQTSVASQQTVPYEVPEP